MLPLHALLEGAERRKLMRTHIFLSGEKPQASPAPANSEHPAPFLGGLSPGSTFVTWPMCSSSFGGKLSAVAALGDGKGAEQFL